MLGALFIGVALMALSTLLYASWLPFVAFLWIAWFIQDFQRHGHKRKNVHDSQLSLERQMKALDWYVRDVQGEKD